MENIKNIQFNTPTTLKVLDGGNRAHVKARILRAGTFTSGVNGITFKITNEDVIKTKDAYNGKFKEFVKNLFRGKEPLYNEDLIQLDPVCCEHRVDDEYVAGRIIGKLFIENDDTDKISWLCANLEVLGKENVDKVIDGRRKAVSINFNTETHELIEVSFVAHGAVSGACIMSGVELDSFILKKPLQNNLDGVKSSNDVICMLNALDSVEDDINSCTDEIERLEQEISTIDKRIEFKNKLQNCVKQAKLSKADMKRILYKVGDNPSIEVMDVVYNTISCLPKSVDTNLHRYSIDDKPFKEFLMSIKEQKEPTTDELLAQLNKFSSNNVNQPETIKDIVESTYAQFSKVESTATNTPTVETNDKVILSNEDIDTLQCMLKDGKHTEASDFIASFKKSDDAPKSKDETMECSKETKGDVKDKKAKEEELKAKKEKLKKKKEKKAKLKAELKQSNAQLSALQSALGVALNGKNTTEVVDQLPDTPTTQETIVNKE